MHFWETISTYRGTHRGIAAQLALNTLNKITATTVVLDLTVDDTYFHIANDEKAAEEFLRTDDPTEVDVMDVLDWAVDQGTISDSDRTLITPVIHERRRCRYRRGGERNGNHARNRT